MPLLEALGKLADFLVRTLWMVLRAIGRSVVGVKRLLSAMHRLRGRGSGGASATARLFDVHAVVLAADLALLVGWFFAVVAPGRLAGLAALGTSLLVATTAALGVRRAPGVIRAAVGLALVLRGLLTVAAAQWLVDSVPLMLVLLALVLPQWTVHAVALLRTRPEGHPAAPMLLRAFAYGLLGCLLTAVPALVLGWIAPAGPFWLAAGLLTLGALLALRLPAPTPSSLPAVPQPSPPGGASGIDQLPRGVVRLGGGSQADPGGASPPAVPQQPTAEKAPEGFHVYRPSTLDDA